MVRSHRTPTGFVPRMRVATPGRSTGKRGRVSDERSALPTPGRRRAKRLVGVRHVSAVGDEMPGHATRRQVIAGVLVSRGVRAGTNAGNGRRPIVCTRNRTDPISGCAKNGDAPVFGIGLSADDEETPCSVQREQALEVHTATIHDVRRRRAPGSADQGH